MVYAFSVIFMLVSATFISAPVTTSATSCSAMFPIAFSSIGGRSLISFDLPMSLRYRAHKPLLVQKKESFCLTTPLEHTDFHIFIVFSSSESVSVCGPLQKGRGSILTEPIPWMIDRYEFSGTRENVNS